MLNSVVDTLWPIASWILFTSLKSVGVIAIVLVAQWLCSRWLSPQHRYGLWFALFACLLIPFGAELDVASFAVGDAQTISRSTLHSMQSGGGMIYDAPKLSLGSTANGFLLNSPGTSAKITILFIWISIAVLLLTHAVKNLIRYRSIRAAASETRSCTSALFLQCKASMGVNRPVLLLQSADIQSPAIFGCWSPTLLLPHGIDTELRQDELRFVFLHELAHVRRHDVFVNWLLTVLQIVHWFNPAIWFASRMLRSDMETACDADAMNRLSASERTKYGHTLIKLSDIAPPVPLLAHGISIVAGHHSLKSRINMIAKFKPKKAAHTIVGVALLTMISSVAVTQPKPTTTPAPASRTSASATDSATAKSNAQSNGTRRNTDSSKTTADGLRTEYIKLEYMKGEDLVALIRPGTGIALLSNQGSATVDARTNTVVIRDTTETLAAVRELAATLDVPLGQVFIEARIAFADDSFIRDLRAKSGGDTPSFLALNSNYDLDAELTNAQASRRAELVSSPAIITANRKEAVIEQGISFPAKDGADAIHMTLRVAMTPQIHSDGRISMSVDLIRKSADSIAQLSAADATAAVDQRKIATRVLFKDQQTVVLGDVSDARSGSMLSVMTDKRLLIFLTTKIARQEVARVD